MRNQKGFTWVPLLIGLVLLGIIGGGTYYAMHQKADTQALSVDLEPSASSTAPTHTNGPVVTAARTDIIDTQFSAGPTSGSAPLSVSFSANQQGLIDHHTNYTINFGDDHLTTTDEFKCGLQFCSQEHTYPPGTYTAKFYTYPPGTDMNVKILTVEPTIIKTFTIHVGPSIGAPNKIALIGTWQENNPSDGTHQIVLRADGTFSQVGEGHPTIFDTRKPGVPKTTGTWEVLDDISNEYYSPDSGPSGPEHITSLMQRAIPKGSAIISTDESPNAAYFTAVLSGDGKTLTLDYLLSPESNPVTYTKVQ